MFSKPKLKGYHASLAPRLSARVATSEEQCPQYICLDHCAVKWCFAAYSMIHACDLKGCPLCLHYWQQILSWACISLFANLRSVLLRSHDEIMAVGVRSTCTCRQTARSARTLGTRFIRNWVPPLGCRDLAQACHAYAHACGSDLCCIVSHWLILKACGMSFTDQLCSSLPSTMCSVVLAAQAGAAAQCTRTPTCRSSPPQSCDLSMSCLSRPSISAHARGQRRKSSYKSQQHATVRVVSRYLNLQQ